MMRGKDVRKFRTDVDHFRKQLKVVEKDLIQTFETWKAYPESSFEVLRKKEKRYRSQKKKLAEMQTGLQALQDGSLEPVRVKPWKITRPSTESRLINFCEA